MPDQETTHLIDREYAKEELERLRVPKGFITKWKLRRRLNRAVDAAVRFHAAFEHEMSVAVEIQNQYAELQKENGKLRARINEAASVLRPDLARTRPRP